MAPDYWDEDEDGKWEPPMMYNPDYKGEWTPQMILNPDYKGEWEPPQLPNPDYVEGSEAEVYRHKDLKFVGIDVWQVKSGSIFDNIVVTDSVEYAAKHAKRHWARHVDLEKQNHEAFRGNQERMEMQNRFEDVEQAADATKEEL